MNLKEAQQKAIEARAAAIALGYAYDAACASNSPEENDAMENAMHAADDAARKAEKWAERAAKK